MKIVLVGYGLMLKSLIEGILEIPEHSLFAVMRIDNVRMCPLKKFFADRFFPSRDYELIKKYNIKDIKASSVNSTDFREFLKKNEIDTVIVGSWSEKFSTETINIVPSGIINVHPSLLPEYRGPDPYLQNILHRETKTGVTFHFINENYDSGDILHQKEVPILPYDNHESLRERCCVAAKSEVKYLLQNFQYLKNNAVKQNENKAFYYPHIKLKDIILNFAEESALETDARIRALSPKIKTFIPYNGEFFSFRSYKLCQEKTFCSPGKIIKKTEDSLYIACKDGNVVCFSGLKLHRPFSKLYSRFFLKKFVKINTKAI